LVPGSAPIAADNQHWHVLDCALPHLLDHHGHHLIVQVVHSIIVHDDIWMIHQIVKFKNVQVVQAVQFETERLPTRRTTNRETPHGLDAIFNHPGPEHFDNVTILRCNVCDFDQLVSESGAPQNIVSTVNNLLNLYDSTIDAFDVFKIEMRGDAYLISCGVPVKNVRHATVISEMALDLLAKVLLF